MRTCECVSSFFQDSIGYFQKEELTRIQKIVGAVALTVFTILTGGIFLLVEFGIHYWINRNIQNMNINTIVQDPDRNVRNPEWMDDYPVPPTLQLVKEETTQDGKYTTHCYNLLNCHSITSNRDFASRGVKVESFSQLYPKGLPVIVPRLTFFNPSEHYSEPDLRWIEWIIAYSGSIHPRSLGWARSCCNTQFKAYVELLMNRSNSKEMIVNIAALVKTAGSRDCGIDDHRTHMTACCRRLSDDDKNVEAFFSSLSPLLGWK